MKLYEQLLKATWKWSQKAFGKGYHWSSIVDHITKELEELKDNPYALEEWIDLMFLSIDGANRCVKMQYPQLNDEEVVAVVRSAYAQKLKINKSRNWNSGNKSEGKAIEHIRTKGEKKFNIDKALVDASNSVL